MSQYTTEGWARGSLHCCVLYIWLRLHFIYHLVIIYVEVIYNSGHYHQVLSSSELSPPQVTDAVWPGLLAPVVPHFRASPTFIYDVWGPSSDTTSNCLLYIRSTEANCCHKIP